MKIKTLTNQTIFDLAVQIFGMADAAQVLALENNMSVTDSLVPGQELTVPALWQDIANRQIAAYYANNALTPATGATGDSIAAGGINYMGIEINFVVS